VETVSSKRRHDAGQGAASSMSCRAPQVHLLHNRRRATASLRAANWRRSGLHWAPGPRQAGRWRAASPPLSAALPTRRQRARRRPCRPRARGAARGAPGPRPGAAERVREGALGSAMGIWREATKRLMDLEAQIVRTVRPPGARAPPPRDGAASMARPLLASAAQSCERDDVKRALPAAWQPL